MRRLALILVFAVVFPVGWLEVAPAATGPAGSHQAMGDFDGDGFDDLAVGAPGDDEAGPNRSGAVNVLYGSPSGPSDAGNQLWLQNGVTLQDPPEADDGFGGPVMAGDFDGDGFDDLAIAAALEDVGAVESAGAVHVLYGGLNGLTDSGDQFLTQGQDGIPGQPEESASFGFALAAGDIDRDGRDDLAIGAPGDDVNGVQGAGSATVLYGTGTGLDSAGSQYLHRAVPGVAGSPRINDLFGIALALADFGRARSRDIAIGVAQLESPRPGQVAVLYSSGGRLRTRGDQVLHQGRPRIPGIPREGDLFGFSLAAGNFGGTRQADLAIGVPGDRNGRGVVHVLRGSSDGLTSLGNQLWHQGVRGIVGDPSTGDNFGIALAVGNLGRSRHADLVIGAGGEDVAGAEDAGAVNVIYGSRNGLSARGDQRWHQGRVPGDQPEEGDAFGISLAVGNFGNGARDDLAIGVPGEDSSSGVVLALEGRTNGLSATGAEYWDQDSTNILGVSGASDLFGFFGPCILL